MPRQPNPELEADILDAAHKLWRRGGEPALTMRAVARAAKTNTPAVYRRFKSREDLVRGILRQIAQNMRNQFQAQESVEDMAGAYLDYALHLGHDYELFYRHSRWLTPKAGGRPIREFRPNFAFAEKTLAKRLGGSPREHTETALALWAILHGATMLVLNGAVPPEHREALRSASRVAVAALLESAERKRVRRRAVLRARRNESH